MGEHPAAVDPLPPEGVVRKGVGLVPGDLLGEEPVHPGEQRQLREGGGVAEGVRQPHPLALHAELLGEEALAVHQLTGQRLAAGQVAVRLDPHSADRRPLPGPCRLLHPPVDLRPAVPHPGVLLGLRAGEDEVGVLLRQGGHIGEGPGRLALGLAERPEPGAVDMGVADGGDGVGTGVGRSGQHLDQPGAGLGGGARHVQRIDGVQGVVDGAQQLVPARVAGRQLVHHSAGHLQVERQVPDVLVQDGEVGAGHGVERVGRRGELVAEGGGADEAVPQDVGVGGGLQQQVDPLAALGPLRHRHVLVLRLDALERPSVRVVDQGLGLMARPGADEPEVEHRLHPPPGPLGRHLAGGPDPQRGPRPPPALAHREGPPVRLQPGHRLGDRHRLVGDLPGRQFQRHGGGVDGGPDALGQHPFEPCLGEQAIVVHARVLTRDVQNRHGTRPADATGPAIPRGRRSVRPVNAAARVNCRRLQAIDAVWPTCFTSP